MLRPLRLTLPIRRLPRPLLAVLRRLRLTVLWLARPVLRLATSVRRLPATYVLARLPLRRVATGVAGLLTLRSGVRVVLLRLLASGKAGPRALWSACGTWVVPTGRRIGVVGHMPPRVSGGLTTGPKQANAPAAMTLTRQVPIRLQQDLPATSWPR